jgi:hypothetical protein
MHPPPICWSHLKRSFWRSDFLLKYHRNPYVLERRSWKKREKEKEKEKLQKSLEIKGKLTFWEEKYASTSKFFSMWSHFLPLRHTIPKALSKIIEKNFLTLFGPSISLAIYMTWVVPFLLTHELHIFSL